MLFTSSLLSTSWTKTRPAQKLLVRVKFTGNPYSYVCERPPLKYTQTLFAGTRMREPVQCRTRTRGYVNAALGYCKFSAECASEIILNIWRR